MTDLTIADALRAQAAALRGQADVLEALAAAVEGAPIAADLLDMADALAQFGAGRDALKAAAARGELAVHRGPRGKLLVRRSDLEGWLTSRPLAVRPRPPKPSEPANDAEDWDRMADLELRSAGGSK